MGVRHANGPVWVALIVANMSACMFFRSLEELTSEARSASAPDGGNADAPGPEVSPPDANEADALTAADVISAEGGKPPDPVVQGFCATQDSDAGPGGYYRCFDYDDPDAAAYGFATFGGVTMGVEDAGTRGNVLTVRFPPMPSSSGTARHDVETSFTPKHVELSYNWQMDWTAGQAGDGINGPTVYRSDVYAYLWHHFDGAYVSMNEQDQRVTPLVNGPPHDAFALDMRQWHRLELRLDFAAATFTVGVDGVERFGGNLEWPIVAGNAQFWIGTPYHYGNQAPIVMRLDDVVIRARP